jgi:hypothetical protein
MSTRTPAQPERDAKPAPGKDAPTDDRELDETIDETFPASDPPANTGETGIRVGTVPRPRRSNG